MNVNIMMVMQDFMKHGCYTCAQYILTRLIKFIITVVHDIFIATVTYRAHVCILGITMVTLSS